MTLEDIVSHWRFPVDLYPGQTQTRATGAASCALSIVIELLQEAEKAAPVDRLNAGSSNAAKIAIIAATTSSSINVKPRER